MRYFLGVDVGSSKTHALLADENFPTLLRAGRLETMPRTLADLIIAPRAE